MPLENYIICVFCLVDDLIKNEPSVRKRGFPPVLPDTELITMLLVGEFMGLGDNKRIWIEFKSHYKHFFPKISMVSYKVFNKQATNLWQVMVLVQEKLLFQMNMSKIFIADGIPLPTCHYARSSRSKLLKSFVNFGYCSSKEEYYYGFKMLLVTTDTGIPISYVINRANIDERSLLLKANIPANSSVIADKGFIGKDFAIKMLNQNQITILTKKRKI